MTGANPILPADPIHYRIETKTRASVAVTVAACALIALLAALPAIAGRDVVEELIFVFYMLALAQCWNLLAGYTGLVSVGQQAFVGLGGYILFALTIVAGLNPLVAIVLAGIAFVLFVRRRRNREPRAGELSGSASAEPSSTSEGTSGEAW